MPFVHLQSFSYYSLHQSPLSPTYLVKRAKELGYDQLALTDSHLLSGAIEFYRACQTYDIQPIIGLTLHLESQAQADFDELVLLAKNEKGYQNLLKIATLNALREPLQLMDLANLAEEVVAILPFSKVAKVIAADDVKNPRYADWLAEYRQIFPDFYLGVTPTYLPVQVKQWLDTLDVPLVALPNVRYTNRQEHYTKNLLEVIREKERYGKVTMGELNPNENDQTEMLLAPQAHTALYEKVGLKQAATNTEKIANQIHLNIELGEPTLPKFPDTDGKSSEVYLKELCKKALKERIKNPDDTYQRRLNYELEVIHKMGFSDYFLIVWDIINFAHEQHILTGSGRGSSAGSLVAYVLGITDVDPLKFDLIFERFLNEERYTMPDIDLDFAHDRRDEILEYLAQKYSKKFVAQICTFGTYQAKAALREVGRVFGLSREQQDQWARAVSYAEGGSSLEEALKTSTTLQKLVSRSKYNHNFFEMAKALQGIPKNISTHAAGVVLSEHPLTQVVPLMASNQSLNLTQFTMEDVESVGLLKLDILGVKNLTILANCAKLSRYEEYPGVQNIADIPLDDPKTLEIFKNAQTEGIFQFESEGIKRVLKNLAPTNFEDIVAVIALYRPGPMQQIDRFIARKHKKEPVNYPHPDLEPILKVTYGIMVYQEQIMRVASKMAGYSLNEADMLRRMVSKKDVTSMEQGFNQFVERSKKRGYKQEVAANVYHLIEHFADYGFNRSHAVAYSKVAYQLAYFKAHYPASFYGALLRQTSSSVKMNRLLNGAVLAKVKIAPPHINWSWSDWSIKGRELRFGLSQIKEVPRNFIQTVIDERQAHGKYMDLLDFIKRMPDRWRDSKQILPLIKAGAFDEVGQYNRAEMIDSLDSVIDSTTMSRGNIELLQVLAPTIVRKEDLPDEEKREQTQAMIGHYFGDNGLDEAVKAQLKQLDLTPSAAFKEGHFVKVLVRVQQIKTIRTKKGEPMSLVTARDTVSPLTLVVFPKQHREYIKQIKPETYYIVTGTVEIEGSERKILVQTLAPLKAALAQLKQKEMQQYLLCLRFKDMSQEKNRVAELLKLLKNYPGKQRVAIYNEKDSKMYHLLPKYNVKYSDQLVETLTEEIGPNNFKWLKK